jgi:hypothetical protein
MRDKDEGFGTDPSKLIYFLNLQDENFSDISVKADLSPDKPSSSPESEVEPT